jgi:regulator of RNase E activity RraB
MGRKWVKLSDDKASVMRIATELIDEDMISLSEYKNDPDIEHHFDKKKLDMLKKRKLVSIATKKSYKVTKGTEYAPERAKLET